MQGAMEAGAESLSLICCSLTGRTATAGRRWNGTDSAEWEEFFVALSWISPSSLPDKAMEQRCSASLHKSDGRPAASACPGGFYNSAEWVRAAEAAQILE